MAKMPPFRAWQPVVLFLLGCAAFVWQVVVEQTDRPMLLALIAGMLGFPLAQTADRLRTIAREQQQQQQDNTLEGEPT